MTKQFIETPAGTLIETNHPEYWPDSKPISRTEGKRRKRQEAIEYLREMFPVGAKVWTKVTHVSASGMSRHIEVFAVKGDEIRGVSGWVADALEWRKIDGARFAVKVDGCGMDMGFHLVNTLAYCLHSNGDALKHCDF